MSFKTELDSLNPPDRKQTQSTILVALAIAIAAYFFGNAPYFALVIVPVVALWTHASNRGVGLTQTPRLYLLLCLAVTAVIMICSKALPALR
jgi:hypothetical protein